MDLENKRIEQIFLDVQRDLPRQGPGNRESTARALELVGSLPHVPRVLDIGCGPGMQTLHLAELLPEASFTAVDYYPQYLDELKERFHERGIAHLVEIVRGDMGDLGFAEHSFDLVWCEGAAYILGVPTALGKWRRLLVPGGKIALSEATWFCADPPPRVREFWDEGYPAMVNAAANASLFEAAGYRMLGHFPLPDVAWWDDYYTPLTKRLFELKEKYAGDQEALAVIGSSEYEIEMFREHSDCYGYTFFAAERD